MQQKGATLRMACLLLAAVMLLFPLRVFGSTYPISPACLCINCTACLLSATAYSCFRSLMFIRLALQLKQGFSYLQASFIVEPVCSLQKQSS